jgi:hypothetical protein
VQTSWTMHWHCQIHILDLSNVDVTERTALCWINAVVHVFSEIKVLFFYVYIWLSVPRALENFQLFVFFVFGSESVTLTVWSVKPNTRYRPLPFNPAPMLAQYLPTLHYLVKPRDYFLYHQLWHSKILHGTHIAFMFCARNAEQTATFTSYNFNGLVLCNWNGIYSAVRAESLYKTE